MRRITNSELLGVAVTVLWLLALVIVMQPNLETGQRFLVFSLLGISIAGIATAAKRILEKTVRKDVWQQPVSPRVGSIVINSVVVVWLCVFGLIVLLTLREKNNLETLVVVTSSIVIGGALGRYMRNRLADTSLLFYGVGSFISLLLILLTFALTR